MQSIFLLLFQDIFASLFGVFIEFLTSSFGGVLGTGAA